MFWLCHEQTQEAEAKMVEIVEANARLMAAAPDLLAVCKEMDDYLLKIMGDPQKGDDNFHTRLREAIAKAEKATATK